MEPAFAIDGGTFLTPAQADVSLRVEAPMECSSAWQRIGISVTTNGHKSPKVCAASAAEDSGLSNLPEATRSAVLDGEFRGFVLHPSAAESPGASISAPN